MGHDGEERFEAEVAGADFQFRTIRFDDRLVTGAQIAMAAGGHPVEEYVVLAQLATLELEFLRPTETANLSKRVTCRFFVIRGDKTFRFFVDGLSMEWPLPLTPPTGPYVSPDIHPIKPESGPHPTFGVHRNQAQPFSAALGGDWQYWSRPFPDWPKSKKTVAAYMAHVASLWASQ